MTHRTDGLRSRRRRAPFFDHVPYTRWPGKGHKLQLRWWLTGYGSVNLGMYEKELVVAVRRKLIPRTRHHPDTPLGLWAALTEVLAEFRRLGVDGLREVLPMYVRRRADGDGYRAEVSKGGRKFELPGPFMAPEDAHRAMVELLTQEFPKRKPKRQTKAL